METNIAPVSRLLERERELDAAAAALDQAAGGSGVLLAVECAAGIGKTALLDAIAADAADQGFTVLRARGIELETVLAFGVVRQLLGRLREDEVLVAAPAAARQVLQELAAPGPESDDPFPALHGLYSVCAALAERAPLLLAIDDAQWADGASLRFVAFLRERLDGLRVAVLLGLRPPAHGDRDALAAQLAGDRRSVRLEPGALGRDAAGKLVRERVPDASDALCRACYDATGGNPFYLRSLAHELTRAPGRLAPEDVSRLAPEAVARAVLGRLAELGQDAVAVAQAVAILETDADVRLVAAFTGLPIERVTTVADDLVQEGVLADARPLAFVHPIVRSAVLADIPTGRQGLEHRRAARLLVDAGAPEQRVAVHLLATEPAGEGWVVDALERGAAAARGPGGRETGVALLRRALAEPPPPDRRAAVLGLLGTAERHVMAPEAARHLEEALAATTDGAARLALTVELAAARDQQGRLADALELLEEALLRLDEHGGDGAATQCALLEAQLVAGRAMALVPALREARARARERLTRLDPRLLEARLLAGVLAFDEVAHGGGVTGAAALAHTALADALPAAALESPLAQFALAAASAAGAPHLAVSATDIDAVARETGSRWATAAASTWRALAQYRCGDLAEAEVDASYALDAFADLPVGLVATAGVLADIVLERRGPAPAARVIDQALAAAPPVPVVQMLFLHGARARVALARQDVSTALAAAAESESLLGRAGIDVPTFFPWRRDLALARHAAGDGGDARDAAAQHLERARACGDAGTIAEALVALGRVSGGEGGLELLREAAGVAEGSGRPLVEAHALGALGGAMRRAGQVSDSRGPLRAALERADDCGATALAKRLREELEAAGVRPRRRPDDARWELTASELRVCRLAAGEMTNREIAQTLFITVKTVEAHLRAAFRKLDIDSRRQLSRALERHAGASQD